MTKQETIERWAKYIIPAVFKAEDALQKAQPEWRTRLAALNDDTPHEVGEQLAKEYCTAVAEVIVMMAGDCEDDEE